MIEVQVLVKKDAGDKTADVQVQYVDCPEGCDEGALVNALAVALREVVDNTEVNYGDAPKA